MGVYEALAGGEGTMEGMQVQEMASNLLLELDIVRDRLRVGAMSNEEALRRVRVVRQRRVNKEVSAGVLRYLKSRETVGEVQNLE
jgi:hypothetical protein